MNRFSRATLVLLTLCCIGLAVSIYHRSPSTVKAQGYCQAGCEGSFNCDNGPYCDSNGNWVCPGSPILVDVLGNGFSLTDAADGVYFDIRNRGVKDLVSWTANGSDDAWLALDRNGNGRIDGVAELFGDATPQPQPPVGQSRNGFLALAVFDQPSEGGNSDGVIDAHDSVFARLRLWRDQTRNGVSEPGELLSLAASGVRAISLDYKESKRVDEYGNRFRFRSRLSTSAASDVGKWAWDVFLKVITVQTSSTASRNPQQVMAH